MLGNSRKLRRLNTHRLRQHSNSCDWDNRNLDTDSAIRVGDRRDAALHFALKEAQKTQEDLVFPERVE